MKQLRLRVSAFLPTKSPKIGSKEDGSRNSGPFFVCGPQTANNSAEMYKRVQVVWSGELNRDRRIMLLMYQQHTRC